MNAQTYAEAFKIWQADQQLQRKPAKFSEHILSGYTGYISKDLRIEDLSAKVRVKELMLPSGAQALILQPRVESSRNTLVSLHGGPESFEGTEIRYLGLYRELLRMGWTVQILNYRGSSNLSQRVNRKAWGNWSHSIRQDYRELQVHHRARQKISLLGASFGGALACNLRQYFQFKKIILLSPLLDLPTQIHRGGRHFSVWFGSRFSYEDAKDFSISQLTGKGSGQVLCISSGRDLVLGTKTTQSLRSQIDRNLCDWKLINQNCGHAPRAYQSSFTRYQLTFKHLTAR